MAPLNLGATASALWDRTVKASLRTKASTTKVNHPTLGLVDGYLGHHLIGRDMPVKNGVYVGAGSREALLADAELAVVYTQLVKLIANDSVPLRDVMIMRIVYTLVRELLPLTDPKVIKAKLASMDIEPDQLVPLSLFLELKMGCCRHQALLAVYLIQELIENGLVNGTCSLDRNETAQGAHAWARWTDPTSGRAFIIDCTLGYCSWRDTPVSQPHDYRRAEDHKPTPIGDTNMDETPAEPSRWNKPAILFILGSSMIYLSLPVGIGMAIIRSNAYLEALQAENQQLREELATERANQAEIGRRIEESNAELATAKSQLEATNAELKKKLDPSVEPGVNFDEVQKSCQFVTPAGCSFEDTPKTCKQIEADVGKVDLTDCPTAKVRMMTIRCQGKLSPDFTTFLEEPHDCYEVPPEGP